MPIKDEIKKQTERLIDQVKKAIEEEADDLVDDAKQPQKSSG